MMKKRNFYRLMFVVLLALLPLSGMSRTIRGDVNRDGCIDINDITALIHYVLTGDASSVDVLACQVNYTDNTVNVEDVTELIKMVLNGAYCPPIELTIPEGSVTYTVNGVEFQMVPVDGGTFMMGGTSTQNTPIHQVTLSSYWIGLTEVTVGLWKAVMGSFDMEMYEDDQPASNMSWSQCHEFIARLNELTGMNFCLPTEAQWEFAARGGNLSQGYTFAGSNYLNEVAWFNGNFPWSYRQIPCVGTKSPNELGLYDMSGSLREFCQDAYYAPYPSDPQVDPLQDWPANGKVVGRGGSFFTDSIYCAVNSRWSLERSTVQYDCGLRLALGPD